MWISSYWTMKHVEHLKDLHNLVNKHFQTTKVWCYNKSRTEKVQSAQKTDFIVTELRKVCSVSLHISDPTFFF